MFCTWIFFTPDEWGLPYVPTGSWSGGTGPERGLWAGTLLSPFARLPLCKSCKVLAGLAGALSLEMPGWPTPVPPSTSLWVPVSVASHRVSFCPSIIASIAGLCPFLSWRMPSKWGSSSLPRQTEGLTPRVPWVPSTVPSTLHTISQSALWGTCHHHTHFTNGEVEAGEVVTCLP